jgi:hypothetical protein
LKVGKEIVSAMGLVGTVACINRTADGGLAALKAPGKMHVF